MCEQIRDRVDYVKIFVDSQAAISALGNPQASSRAVVRAMESLNTLAQRSKSVTIVWIPAHKGHNGKERADVLAKRGTKETDPERMVLIGKPQAAFKMEIKSNIYREWQEGWNDMKVANHAKGLYSGLNPHKARYVYTLARLELGRFGRIVTGHNNLNFFQNKLGLSGTRLCCFCGMYDETLTHFMAVCPRFVTSQREILLNQLPTADMIWSVCDFFYFSYVPGINEAFEGTWTSGDPSPEGDRLSDASFGLERLDDNNDYDNNNSRMSTGISSE